MTTPDLLLRQIEGVLGVLVGETEGFVGRLVDLGSLLGFTDGSDDGSIGKSVLESLGIFV